MIIDDVRVPDDTPLRLIGIQTRNSDYYLVVETVEKFGVCTLTERILDIEPDELLDYESEFWDYFLEKYSKLFIVVGDGDEFCVSWAKMLSEVGVGRRVLKFKRDTFISMDVLDAYLDGRK